MEPGPRDDQFIGESTLSTRLHRAHLGQAQLDDLADAERLAGETQSFLLGVLTPGLELFRAEMAKQGRVVRFSVCDGDFGVLIVTDPSKSRVDEPDVIFRFEVYGSLSIPGALRLATTMMRGECPRVQGLCGLVEDLRPDLICRDLLSAWRARGEKAAEHEDGD